MEHVKCDSLARALFQIRTVIINPKVDTKWLPITFITTPEIRWF
jgi:hypothetical protein